MDDRFNTIAGWVLFAGIVALGSSIVAGETFKSERPEEMGYPIEGVVQEGEGAAEAEKPIAFYLATADAAAGDQVFKKCTACHNADKGGANALGPNLWGIMGEPVGKGHGYAFSPALAGVGGTWNWDNLSAWLASPKKFAPGTKMTFAGLSNPQDRANVIAYLHANGGGPAFPAPVEAVAPEAGAPESGEGVPEPEAADAAAAGAVAADQPVPGEDQTNPVGE